MKANASRMLSALLAGIAMVATASVAKAEEITVAYFLEWPMPFQYAKVKGLYDEALGMKINWVASTPAPPCRRRWPRATCRSR
jgi:ABC-type nitrate/sulfonate/bicarbonate transport system substrate-binding protein